MAFAAILSSSPLLHANGKPANATISLYRKAFRTYATNPRPAFVVTGTYHSGERTERNGECRVGFSAAISPLLHAYGKIDSSP
uniref:Uncharacterized protein n=1 Tax=Phage sp. ctKtV17 TaxID=2825792 RepID=A0A8S5UYP6_9VIRU|nr:MAG TPA: hypothetical protein [Phage sp. ctKtV17]